MKKKKQPRLPSPRQASVLRQLVELIPAYLVPQLARQHGVDRQSRTFTPWSHVVTMLYAQFTHALSQKLMQRKNHRWTQMNTDEVEEKTRGTTEWFSGPLLPNQLFIRVHLR